MKKWILLFVFALLAVGLVVAIKKVMSTPLPPINEISTELKTTVVVDPNKIKQIEELELLVLPYGNVVHRCHQNKKGKVEAEVYYMFNGVGQLSLNMKEVNVDCLNDMNGNITGAVVRLPDVKVTGARVLHYDAKCENEYEWISGIIGEYKETKQMSIQKLDHEARTEAQKDIAMYMCKEENVRRAREQAELILKAILRPIVNGEPQFQWPKEIQLDWKKVNVDA